MDIEHIQNAKAAVPTDADGRRGAALNLDPERPPRTRRGARAPGRPSCSSTGSAGRARRSGGMSRDLGGRAPRRRSTTCAARGRASRPARPVLASTTSSATCGASSTRSGSGGRARGHSLGGSIALGVRRESSATTCRRWSRLGAPRASSRPGTAGLARPGRDGRGRGHGRGCRDGGDERRVADVPRAATRRDSASSSACSPRTTRRVRGPRAAPSPGRSAGPPRRDRGARTTPRWRRRRCCTAGSAAGDCGCDSGRDLRGGARLRPHPALGASPGAAGRGAGLRSLARIAAA